MQFPLQCPFLRTCSRVDYRAAENQNHSNGEHRLVHVHDGCWQLAKVECASIDEQDHDANDKANVTYPVRNKGFDRCACWRETILSGFGSLVEPEADKQVRTETYQFPSDEDHQEICRKDDHKHGKSKERKVGVETSISR